jgi:hypothetical protein
MGEVAGVGEWLRQQGYPFEFAVAKAFRAAGFDVYQGIHYPADSPDALGAREIDVLAVRQELVQRRPMTKCTVVFVVECKSSSQPWATFRGVSSGGKWEATGHYPMNGVTEAHILGALKWEQDPWLLALPLAHSYRVVATWQDNDQKVRAKGSAGPGQRDAAYAAVAQVLAAAEGLLERDPKHLPTVAFPVLAVSSSLYAINSQTPESEILPIEWERVAWRGDRDARTRVLDVVSGSAVEEYARVAWAAAGELLPILRDAALVRREEDFERESLQLGRADAIAGIAMDVIEGAADRASRAKHWLRARFARVR